jgi:hypothetical protein
MRIRRYALRLIPRFGRTAGLAPLSGRASEALIVQTRSLEAERDRRAAFLARSRA